MRSLHVLGVTALLLAAVACSVPPVTFTPGDEIDAGDPDAPPDAPPVVMMVVSDTSVDVGEGGQATFTVHLDNPPQGSVLIDISSSDGTKVGVTPATIQFDQFNFSTPRSVTVTGREDADVEDELEVITLSSSVGDVDVTVNVNDNDGLGIEVTPAAGIDVTEGDTAQVSVHLTAQPSGSVTVMVGTADAATATASPTMLTFTAATWNLDQAVVVSGTDDADITDDTTELQLTGTGLADVAVPITVSDDDVLGILPSTTNLGAVSEGASTTFTVRLTQLPTGPVTVGVASSDTLLLTVSPASLAFTTANWNTAQTVTVTLPQDVDTTDEIATISLTATGLATRTVSATIRDDDTQTIVPSPVPLSIDEGMSRELNVRLAFQPAAPITLTVTSLATSVVTASPATLTFTPSDYDTTQPVTVTAVEDADAAPGATSIRLESVADNLTTDVPVPVTDNDQLLIETSAPSVTLGESGTVTFGVRLTAMPAATVVVNVSPSDPTAVSVGPTPLSFSTANWSTFQMVTVTGVQDTDLANETLTVTLAASGLPAKTVDVTVTDDDMQVVVMSAPSISVNEGGTGTLGIALMYQPAGTVTVTVASGNTAVATVAPTMLSFTTANFATPQSVTVTGVDDADAVDGAATITASATGATAGTTTVTVQDNDALGIETNVTTLTVAEGGTGTVGVRLTAQPAASTTVMVMSSDAFAASVSTASLTFTTGNWNTYQNVTVTGVDDADPGNESVTLTFSSAPLANRTVNVTVTDNDPQGIVTTTSTVTLGEAGTTTFGVRLAAQPSSDTVVMIMSNDITAATTTQTMLTFTPANYASNQTVTVNGVGDADLASETVAINLSASGMPTVTVTATVTDDDMQVVVFSTSAVTVAEGGSTNVNVSLMYQPAANVTVNLSSANAGIAGVSPSTRTFTSANYATGQAVTVSGAEDADAATSMTTITASATGATSATLTATVTDNDTLGLETSLTSLTIGEAGSGSFGVRLTAQPPGDVTVMISSNDPGAATSPTTMLTFTTASWSSFQTVTVNGVDDADPSNEAVTFTVSSTGLTSRTVSVTVTDNDPQGIVLSATTVSLGESTTATVNVRLNALPPGNVTVNVTSLDTGAARVAVPSLGTLTFTTASWNVDQAVTIAGVSDNDLANESVAIELTSTGLSTRTVTANVTDDDTQVVLVNPSTITVPEGMTATFGVTLMFAPTGTATVTCTSNGTGIATVTAGGSLSFTAADYTTAKNVTVSGVSDATADNEMTTVTCASTGATSGVVTVNVTDDEVLAFETDVGSVALTEPGSGSFRVRLTAQPLSTVNVTVASGDLGTVLAQPTSLSFTTSNWNVYQPVNVTAVDDYDPLDETVNVTMSAQGLPNRSVAVAVDDQDLVRLIITEVMPGDPDAEYVEIFNPWPIGVDLSNYWISDWQSYYRLPAGTQPQNTDFLSRFPAGRVIAPNEVIVVAIDTQTSFQQRWGMPPNYFIKGSGSNAMMSVGATSNVSLNAAQGGGEVVYLFYWDGQSDLVTDVDIVRWGTPPSSDIMQNKGGVFQDGPDADTSPSTYASDAVSMTSPPIFQFEGTTSVRRAQYEDGFESTAGGNGINGDDETSENIEATFQFFVNTGNPRNINPLAPMF